MLIRNMLMGILAACAAASVAAQTPEATYQKLHSAVIKKDMKEVLRYATNARRAEVAANPAAEGFIEAMSGMLPKAYSVTSKTVTPDGNAAELRTTGSAAVMGQRAPMYGLIAMKKEEGEWRIEQWSWSSDRPAAAATKPTQLAQAPTEPAKPEAAAEEAPKKPAAKKKAAAKDAPKVAEITPSKATQVEPCVIKPVMSDAELKRCGASVPIQYEKPVTR